MFLADLSIKRPIMMSMFLIVFLLFGAIAYFGMSLDLMPNVEFPFVTVTTIYGGAGPKEVETQITKKIEDAISSVSKIKEINSYSMENVSLITLEFELDKDVNIANQEVKDKITSILNNLPSDAERPLVEKFNISEQPIIDIILSGEKSMTELYDIGDKKLKDRFSQMEGVARVDITGGEEREIRVELDNRVVFQNQLSLAQLAQMLAVHNIDMPAGNFDKRSQEYSVRLNGKFDDVETIKNLKIPTTFGNKKLQDIARINDTGAKVRERTSFFNNIIKQGKNNVVLLSLVKNAEGNTVDIAENVRRNLSTIESELPAGTRLEIITDKSLFIKSSVADTLSNIFIGIILTALVLLIFLHDIRSTFIAAISMPMSIISAFLFMNMFGFTLNIMTLMGLSTAVGILVTNSVVVLENIFRHKQMGHNRKDSAAKGTAEIVVAVVASAMTNIAVFLPIANMSSMVGQFFKEFALTVTFATIFSLLISFTLTPMLASLILPESNNKKHRIGDKLESIFKSWELGYQKALSILLNKKLYTVLLIVGTIILFVISLPIGGKVGFEFIPIMDEGDINIEVELPVGYNLEESAKMLQSIEKKLKKYDTVKHILINLGTQGQIDVGVNLALIKVKLIDADSRDIKTAEQAAVFIEDLSQTPNAIIRIRAVSSGAGGYDAPIVFYLKGQDVSQLEIFKNQILDKIKDVEGLVNLNTSSRAGKPEISLKPNRQKLADVGATVYDLAMALRGAVDGIVATQLSDKGEEYDIRVKMTDQSINTPEKLGKIIINTHSGNYTLSQLAEINFSEGFSKILHKDKFKTIKFSASPATGIAIGDVVNKINERLSTLELPSSYNINWGGDAEMMQETAKDMIFTFILALILTYMLLAAILESFTQPLLILGSVPFAFIGVFWAMFLTGKTMNIISMMAIVMLLGIVVNNAILLLDYTNELRRKGKSTIDALVEACPTKLKPILMSTIAIILGMLPMALGLGDAGREMRQPMGIVAIGGLIVSSVLTLFVIPALYNLTTKKGTVTTE
jgi:hydrophobic/amphiphilic exporter-1 (mainly G- bacteria), HAE1 family